MTKKEAKEAIIKWNGDVKIFDWNWSLWKSDQIVSFIGKYKGTNVATSSCYYVDECGDLRYLPGSIKSMAY